jgi:hypothetical protein
MSMMKEVELQMQRMQEANEGYQEEKKTLHLQYEKQAEIALQNRCKELRAARQAPIRDTYKESQELKKEIKELKLQNTRLETLLGEKERAMETMMTVDNNMSPGQACILQARPDQKCKHCANGTHNVSSRMRKKLAFPFKKTCGSGGITTNKRVKEQLFTNPEAQFPTATQKQQEKMKTFVNNQKQQSFQIGEIERAVKILFSEIQERLDGCEKTATMIGPPVIVRLAVNVCKMVKEFRKNMTDNEMSEENIKQLFLNATKQQQQKGTLLHINITCFLL